MKGAGSLIKTVQKWEKERRADNCPNAWRDVIEHGCQTGSVSDLIYYHQTVKFYKKHRLQINLALGILLKGLDVPGLNHQLGPQDIFDGKLRPQWDLDDPLALDVSNQNTLAWFAFEDTLIGLHYHDLHGGDPLPIGPTGYFESREDIIQIDNVRNLRR